MPFSKLGLAPSLCTPLARMGYGQPTPVQSESIPFVLSGSDLLARAQTGTGKTAAFGLPMIERLFLRGHPAMTRSPRGLVLVPTRELALQVRRALATYGAPVQLRVLTHLRRSPDGASGAGSEAGNGHRRRHARPAHRPHPAPDARSVGDRNPDAGRSRPDAGHGLPAVASPGHPGVAPRPSDAACFQPRSRPRSCASRPNSRATRYAWTSRRGRVVPPTVTHRVHPVAIGPEARPAQARPDAGACGQTLVFCKTKRGSDRVGAYLEHAGIRVAVIHGNKSQGARTRALGDFKAGRVMVLVATDIAARGLDIAQLPLVVNYDLPLVAEDYIHRVGRTGRAGLAGRAISLVTAADRQILRDIQRLLPAPLEQVVVEGFETVNSPTGPSRQDRGARSRDFARPFVRRLPTER